jgi:hypothetical protein
MKLAIFENEFNNIKAIFDAFNLLHFQKNATIQVFESSQDFGDFKSLDEFDFILIDLDLSPKSQQDGYQIIEAIKGLGISLNKVKILTGHVNPQELLLERGLPKLQILQKPLKLESLEKILL